MVDRKAGDIAMQLSSVGGSPDSPDTPAVSSQRVIVEVQQVCTACVCVAMAHELLHIMMTVQRRVLCGCNCRAGRTAGRKQVT